MSRAEDGESYGGQEFSVNGELIGGPAGSWNRITESGQIINGAYEFINEATQNGNLIGYTFRFPQGSLADIYIEDSNKQSVFTAIGKEGSSLDSRFKVAKIQLYLHSREWDESHEGQWTEWKDNGASVEQTNIWYPIGMTTTPKPDISKNNTQAPQTKERQKPKRLLKWALAGALALGGVGLLNNDLGNSNNSNNNSQQTEVPTLTPIVATEPTITPEELTYDTYDLKFGDTWMAPAYSIVAIPPGSGIVIGPPAAANKVQLNFLKVNENSWGAYDYNAIGVEDTPLMISTPSDLKFYTRDIIVKYNIRYPYLLHPGDVLSSSYYEMDMFGTDNILSTYYHSPNVTLDRILCGLPFISCTIVK